MNCHRCGSHKAGSIELESMLLSVLCFDCVNEWRIGFPALDNHRKKMIALRLQMDAYVRRYTKFDRHEIVKSVVEEHGVLGKIFEEFMAKKKEAGN